MVLIVATNNNPDRIKMKIEYDERTGVWNVDAKLKKKRRKTK